MVEHLSKFLNMVNQLAMMKMALDEELQALPLLSFLPDSWETLVVSLSNSSPEDSIALAIVKVVCLTRRPSGRSKGS